MDKVLLLLCSASLFFLVAMMFFISPDEAGAFGILIFFTLAYIVFFGLAVLLCRLFLRLRNKFKGIDDGGIVRKSYAYGFAIAIAPIMVVMNISAGSIGVLQIVEILIVELLLCVLVARDIV